MAYILSWQASDPLDEQVFSFELTQAEGDFATLKVETTNRHVGLLASGRLLDATFIRDGVTIFYGRVVALPEDLTAEVYTVTFVARPTGYDSDKREAAEDLKVAPFYDPIWFAADRRRDPDVVLEARPALWHVDRVSHAITVSDIVAGEAGTLVVGNGFFYDSLSLTISGTPATQCTVNATVSWDQAAKGLCDVSREINQAFPYGYVASYTGQGLMEDWPKNGDEIGSGWSVGPTLVGRSVLGDTMYVVNLSDKQAGFPLWRLDHSTYFRFDVVRPRTETLTFTVTADVQKVMAESKEDSRITIDISSSEIGLAVDPGRLLPIRDRRRRSYFDTDRGIDSLENLIAMARTKLLARARCVDISFQMPLAAAISLTCRHSVSITDSRLPGGTATGKVKAYTFSLSGDTGLETASVTIACIIGKGGSLSVPATVAGYVVEGYAAPTWVAPTSGATQVADDVYYHRFNIPMVDDGLDMLRLKDQSYTVLDVVVLNGPATQVAALAAPPPEDPENPSAGGTNVWPDVMAAVSAVNAVYTQIAVTMRPLEGGPFEVSFPVTVSALKIPKTINLEASS